MTHSELREHIQELAQLSAFELARHENRTDDDRDEPPTAIGYELMPALAKAATVLPAGEARRLWEPVLQLGGNAHYTVGEFVRSWIQEIGNVDPKVYGERWKEMIGFVLSSRQCFTGRNWFYGERMLGSLLGLGYESLLNKVPAGQSLVWEMRSLYETWANEHLTKDEDNVSYFAGFLASSTGALIRVDGFIWMFRILNERAGVGDRWYRDRTGPSLVDLLSVVLTQNSDRIHLDTNLRNALLGLAALLVKRQVPAALALQDRVRTTLGG